MLTVDSGKFLTAEMMIVCKPEGCCLSNVDWVAARTALGHQIFRPGTNNLSLVNSVSIAPSLPKAFYAPLQIQSGTLEVKAEPYHRQRWLLSVQPRRSNSKVIQGGDGS